ncbi:MAG: serine kinase [candidate division Zixibacteria bacterium]|nr:serine kinase [candidate division Zixibacteria bacterium]
MTTQDLIDKIGLKPLSKFEHRNVDGVFISDMISDVMAGAKSGNLWLTVQTHKSIVPAANLVDVAAIVITSGKEVPQETIALASKYNIGILCTGLPTFELVGKLYASGLSPNNPLK